MKKRMNHFTPKQKALNDNQDETNRPPIGDQIIFFLYLPCTDEREGHRTANVVQSCALYP